MKMFLSVCAILALCSCTAPESRSARDGAAGPSQVQPSEASFPVAAPPVMDEDDRSLEERDRARLGRQG